MTPKAKRYADLIARLEATSQRADYPAIIERFEQDAELRVYRSLERWAMREATQYRDGSAVGEMLRYGVASECRRRAKGKA